MLWANFLTPSKQANRMCVTWGKLLPLLIRQILLFVLLLTYTLLINFVCYAKKQHSKYITSAICSFDFFVSLAYFPWFISLKNRHSRELLLWSYYFTVEFIKFFKAFCLCFSILLLSNKCWMDMQFCLIYLFYSQNLSIIGLIYNNIKVIWERFVYKLK